MSRLRDNQALCNVGLRDRIVGMILDDTPETPSECADRILDAVDRALTATGPGSDNFVDCETCGQPRPRCVEDHGGRRCNEPSTPHTRHNADGVSWTHPTAAPQTDHRAAAWADPYAPDTYRVATPATPPSSSHPGAAEATMIFPYGPLHKNRCGCDFGRAATCGTRAEFIECGCVCHRGPAPAESKR